MVQIVRLYNRTIKYYKPHKQINLPRNNLQKMLASKLKIPTPT